jgi:predicted SAM-dependent methyltransferase
LDFVLGEFFRVLKNGNSLLRVSVPDIEVAVKAYVEKDELFFDHSEVSPITPNAPLGGKLASWFYSTRLDQKTGEESQMRGHVHCFDYEYMAYRLGRVGFQHIWRSSPQASVFSDLRSDAFDRHLMESLFIEAMPHGEAGP